LSLAVAVGLGVAPLLPKSAAAALPDEIQVYADDINKPRTFGLEVHVNSTPSGTDKQDYAGEVTTNHGTRVTPEFSYGLSRDFEAGLYLPTVFSNGDWSLAGYKLRLKWLPLQPTGNKNDDKVAGPFAGANLEYSNLAYRYSASRQNAELRLIAGYRGDAWLVAANPVFGWALSGGAPQPGPQFELGYKLSRKVANGMAIGAEYYNEKGRWLHFDPSGTQGKTLYATIDVDRKPWIFNLGVGRGLNEATDRWTVKAILEVPF
jgi:hypothetical protein